MTDAMAKERETIMEISPTHGQAIHQSYYPRIKEAFQAFKPLVPSLESSVKELYSSLTKLAHCASVHAAKLHKVMSFYIFCFPNLTGVAVYVPNFIHFIYRLLKV